MLRTVFSEVDEIRTSVPYASLDALFTNPSESSVQVKRRLQSGEFQSDYLPMKEILSFVLPGMWTHRAFQGGARYFANHGKDLEERPGDTDTYMLKFDTPETQNRAGTSTGTVLGSLASDVPDSFHSVSMMQLLEYRLEYVGMSRDSGFNSRQAMVKLGHVDGDNGFWANEALPSPGANRTMKRPDSILFQVLTSDGPIQRTLF